VGVAVHRRRPAFVADCQVLYDAGRLNDGSGRSVVDEFGKSRQVKIFQEMSF
jgi:hypothetical protein